MSSGKDFRQKEICLYQTIKSLLTFRIVLQPVTLTIKIGLTRL